MSIADQYVETPGKAAGSGIQRLALVALIMVLLFVTQSFNAFFAEPSTDGLLKTASVRSSPVYMVFVLLQLGLVSLLFLHHVFFKPISMRLLVGLTIGLFALSSVFWSVDAKTTAVPAAIFCYVILAAYVAAVYFDPAAFVRIFFWTTAFIIVASYVLYFTAPSYVIELRDEGGWLSNDQFRGIMTSKNRAGMVFASAVMLALLAAPGRISPFWRGLIVLLGLLGVVLSNAATALVVLVLILALGFWMRYARLLRIQIAFTFSIVLLVLVLALPFIDFKELQIFELFGRDGSLTGRDQLWALAIEYGAKRPAFGYGYYGFFSAVPYSPAYSFWDNFRWFITDSFHNSAADVYISLGLSGVAMLCVVCCGAATLIFNRTIDESARTVLILLVHVALIDSMTNFSIFFHNSLPTFIVFYAFFAAGIKYSGDPVSPLARRDSAPD